MGSLLRWSTTAMSSSGKSTSSDYLTPYRFTLATFCYSCSTLLHASAAVLLVPWYGHSLVCLTLISGCATVDPNLVEQIGTSTYMMWMERRATLLGQRSHMHFGLNRTI